MVNNFSIPYTTVFHRLKKGTLLDVLNNRYSHDMLMRYKKKESLQQTIKSKTNVFETLKVYIIKTLSQKSHFKILKGRNMVNK